MLALILIAVLTTDIAVAVMFVTMRRHVTAPNAEGLDLALASEMEGLVAELRAQMQEAAVELGREKAQLRRMLADLEQQKQAARQPAAPALAPVVTRRDVLGMAAEGLPFRAIAGRTGMSVEEVRLMLAMEDEMAA